MLSLVLAWISAHTAPPLRRVNLPATLVNAIATGSRDPKRQVVARETNETFRGFKIHLDTLGVYDTTP